MKFGAYPKVASFKSVGDFSDYLRSQGIDMPCDDVVSSDKEAPLASPIEVGKFTVGNRFAIQPMEGWDAAEDGNPSANTFRRWRRFGLSGAKLIWGGEAVAVRRDGCANPHQLYMADHTQAGLAKLRETLVDAHREATGDDRNLVIGLQLTHSGRFARPHDQKRLEPKILYRHPILDRKFNLDAGHPLLSDAEIEALVQDYVEAAKRAWACGYDFVDIKHCHGYLGHEFLSAKTRDGRYGGTLENRSRFLREIVTGIRAEAPGLAIGVRLSAFDIVPFRPDAAQSSEEGLGPGIPEDFSECLPYRYGFGVDARNPVDIDLTETIAFLEILRGLDIQLVNVTAGSPYYNPHVSRPALYPPSDGYRPPEEPLAGVMRHLAATYRLKQAFPDMALVGTGYTYLQEYLPNVAQAAIRRGWVDFIGLGRIALAYPELPIDILTGRGLQTKRLCRAFSDCTTAPRNGLVSGCYPLDPFYKKSTAFKLLSTLKRSASAR